MEYLHTIISVISGIVGGNLAGAAMKDKSLGAFGNSLAGFFGGGIGAAILKAIEGMSQTGAAAAQGAAAAPGLDLGNILASIGSGGVGGAVLLAIVSYIRKNLIK